MKRLRAGLDTGLLAIRAYPNTSQCREGFRQFRVSIHAAATAILLSLSLAACQTPAVQTRTVEVKVPVAVQPIKAAQVPAVPAPLGPRPQSLSAAADLLLAKHCEFVAYALKADPLLRLSAGMQQQALANFPECEK